MKHQNCTTVDFAFDIKMWHIINRLKQLGELKIKIQQKKLVVVRLTDETVD